MAKKKGKKIALKSKLQDLQDRCFWTDTMLLMLVLDWVEDIDEGESLVAFLDIRAQEQLESSGDEPDDEEEGEEEIQVEADEDDYEPGPGD